MPAWSLSGPILLALTAPAAGDPEASAQKARAPLRIVDIARRDGYRLPVGRPLTLPAAMQASDADGYRDRRFDQPVASTGQSIRDPQADSVRTLLRDRMARRGGALDARVEVRLTGDGGDVGLGGGLKRVVDTLLHD